MNFVVIDVETANPDLSSICQVGIAYFRDGTLQDSWSALVNPEDEFDPIHVAIHGIDEKKVRSCPNWAAIYPEVSRFLHGNIVASYMAFDRVALLRTCERYELAHSDCHWLDCAMVVRRAWPVFSHSGYALSNVAAQFGIRYKAHDALEDARCAGEILLRAMAETGLGIDGWLERVRQPINPPPKTTPRAPRTTPRSHEPRPSTALPKLSPTIAREANPDGPLYGEVMVFTGRLSMPRHEAADAASTVGCEVATSVSKQRRCLL
jgi:DNA polymerase III subunit epsilon